MASARVNLLYFAQARDIAGTERETMVVSTPTTGGRLAELAVRSHPKLGGLRKVIRVAVNEELVDGLIKLRDGDEVALLPPVMGG